MIAPRPFPLDLIIHKGPQLPFAALSDHQGFDTVSIPKEFPLFLGLRSHSQDSSRLYTTLRRREDRRFYGYELVLPPQV